MTIGIDWHPLARSELAESIDWYDDREAGLGERLERVAVRAVEDCADAPDAWPPWPGWDREPLVRSRAVDGFPYRIIYIVDRSLLTVVAIAHQKRRPGYWRDRVRADL